MGHAVSSVLKRSLNNRLWAQCDFNRQYLCLGVVFLAMASSTVYEKWCIDRLDGKKLDDMEVSNAASSVMAKKLWGFVDGTEALRDYKTPQQQADHRNKSQKALSSINCHGCEHLSVLSYYLM